MTPSRDIARLIEIMAALREPETGCPWDLEQDFSTIAPYTVEEAYEVADAIERDDAVDLKEELGDLLLQVVYHAQLASERDLFEFEDVVEAITRKMIRRHPHVFGDAEARSARSAKGQWERIKAEEKAERAAARLEAGSEASLSGKAPVDFTRQRSGSARLLEAVPASFPALTLALKVQSKAATVGFDWNDPAPIKAKIEEEMGEFDRAMSEGIADASEAEMGDLLFSVANLARYHGIDPEKALRRSVTKFRDRFAHIEDGLALQGKSPSDASLDEMEALWVAAKGKDRGTGL
ncbi:nucleoside triphosphate pyrophosphohydrolase [Jiella marina]|uniref:nucleoside triphosphate pyrophosphohydrolase n=1 Tax=Jiella sp. LLJ827 TaxID=2917712 RepID=UPI002100EC92|nr:nucleoside triphosphate pyrophosphohydrolase [Jiella sp. LLJ827]MCQ0986200.1 nucleoside triphosphate pyrophosphohydrolase [Jiella sp. LLJ827]